MPKVVLLVGPSGVGKSTWVEKFVANRSAVVCSADHFHMVDVVGSDGLISQVYKFDPAKAAMAHSSCMNKYLRSIECDNLDYVIVDNTNVSEWERQNYVAAAVSRGLSILYVVWCVKTIEEIKLCAARNKHGVSAGVIADMALRMDFDSAAALSYFRASVRHESIKLAQTEDLPKTDLAANRSERG